MPAALKTRRRDDVVYVRRSDEVAADVLDELAVVKLLNPIRTSDGTLVPPGSIGAVVAVWRDGEAYEVEFTEPVAALATVRRPDLREVSPA